MKELIFGQTTFITLLSKNLPIRRGPTMTAIHPILAAHIVARLKNPLKAGSNGVESVAFTLGQ